MKMIAGYVHANRLDLPAIISILVVLPFPTLLASTEILSFSFPDPKSLQETQNLSLSGEASVSPIGIALTDPRTQRSAGWATYNKPLHLWDNATRRVADFASNFSFVIKNVSEQYAEGIAFFLTPSGATMDESHEGWGFALTTSTSATYDGSSPPFIAVEFDTYAHEFDPNYPHVGIDINTIHSRAVASWEWNRITAGGKVNAMVVYNSSRRILSVKITDADNASAFSTINYNNLNLMDYLPEWVTFGFSAATNTLVEINLIQSWNFTSSLEVQDPPSSVALQDPPKKKKNSYWQWIIIGVGSFFFICLVLGFLWWSRRQPKRNGNSEDGQDCPHQRIDGQTPEPSNGETGWPITPKVFSFNQLATATNYFSIDRLLGRGGCGEVYEGHLREGNYKVAIKKFTHEYTWGIREFRAEVTTISQLRHKNLVQLYGWCHENEQLLLIYELMPNGSLYDHLFEGRSLLTGKMRYQIAQGLASALHYLHEYCVQCVLHRDIKANNVMLDSDFNAKLGDFGLARIVEHAKGSKTTVCAGTWGYMAPESFHTGKVAKESDIFSLGIVMLEIASGKKVIDPTDGDFRLVDWVWEFYGTRKLRDAVDPKVKEDYDRIQMQRLMLVGLWCAHPDDCSRPTITMALSVLRGEASLPNLPPLPPFPTYDINQEYEPFHTI